MEGESLSDHFFEDSEFDIFSILEALEGGGASEFNMSNPTTTTTTTTTSDEINGLVSKEEEKKRKLVSQKSTGSSATLQEYSETEADGGVTPNSNKRQKLAAVIGGVDEGNNQMETRISHITVERNRRKQMNEHLSVLRSLMPCFYAKRGDQASIIGGVVDYINELQQVLQSLEAKKQRKVYSEVLSPRLAIPSPRVLPSPLSPRKPPLSPKINLPISPRTPQPTSPYNNNNNNNNNRLQQPTISATPLEPSPTSSSTNSSIDSVNELAANSKSAIADVEVKFSGANVILKTVSPRIPGQAVKIIAALEELALEILHVSISTIDGTMLNSFTIKIGIECQLSAEELAHQIQQTFC
ncbi:transcription factor SPEECHLESS-like [Nicotiana tabacum]|uniref:Transcription factor SPEECHLESS-like n=2 Tax=Nicotiana TaxID=4085 RepID=A0A1S3XII0_TOBAC|nr:PREDICTED: transcription factor SPEECHLESS [Nicotiana sylvestris]XP_016439723.1 PREDICTED: transcription factor SPEECHLESS-like [Nicotiana tabacum]